MASPTRTPGKDDLQKNGTVDQPSQCNCTFCGSEVTLSLSCDGLEKTIRRNLYMSLQIHHDASDLEKLSQVDLPVCGRCRDKVVMMACNWKNYLFARKNFEDLRNDLAFSTIESRQQIGNSSASLTPMDQIREKICDKWMGTYMHELNQNSSKEEKSPGGRMFVGEPM